LLFICVSKRLQLSQAAEMYFDEVYLVTAFVLGQFSGQQETDSSLDLATGDG
jgi:hypothetical protein